MIAERGYSSVVERSLCMREASGSIPDISIVIFVLFFDPIKKCTVLLLGYVLVKGYHNANLYRIAVFFRWSNISFAKFWLGLIFVTEPRHRTF